MTYSIRYELEPGRGWNGGYMVLLHSARTTYKGQRRYKSYASAERAAKATGATERRPTP